MANNVTIDLKLKGLNVAVKGVKKLSGVIKTGFGKVKSVFSAVGRVAKKMWSAILGPAAKVLAILGAISGAGLGFYISQSFAALDSTNKLAAQLNVTTEAIQGLRFAGELTGASMSEVDKSLEAFSRRLGRVGTSQGKVQEDILKELGLDPKAIRNLPIDEAVLEVADSFSKMNDAARKAQIAQELFSRGGVRLINTLNLGKEGLIALKKEAKDLGLAVSFEDAQEIEAANDELLRLRSAFRGIANFLAVTLAPVVKRISTFIKDGIVSLRQNIETLRTTFQKTFEGVEIIVKSVLSDVAATGSAIFSGLFGDSEQFGKNVEMVAKNVLKSALVLKDGVKNVAKFIFDTIKWVAQNGSDVAIKGFEMVGTTVLSSIDKATGGLVSFFKWLTGAISGVFKHIKNFFLDFIGLAQAALDPSQWDDFFANAGANSAALEKAISQGIEGSSGSFMDLFKDAPKLDFELSDRTKAELDALDLAFADMKFDGAKSGGSSRIKRQSQPFAFKGAQAKAQPPSFVDAIGLWKQAQQEASKDDPQLVALHTQTEIMKRSLEFQKKVEKSRERRASQRAHDIHGPARWEF